MAGEYEQLRMQMDSANRIDTIGLPISPVGRAESIDESLQVHSDQSVGQYTLAADVQQVSSDAIQIRKLDLVTDDLLQIAEGLSEYAIGNEQAASIGAKSVIEARKHEPEQGRPRRILVVVGNGTLAFAEEAGRQFLSPRDDWQSRMVTLDSRTLEFDSDNMPFTPEWLEEGPNVVILHRFDNPNREARGFMDQLMPKGKFTVDWYHGRDEKPTKDEFDLSQSFVIVTETRSMEPPPSLGFVYESPESRRAAFIDKAISAARASFDPDVSGIIDIVALPPAPVSAAPKIIKHTFTSQIGKIRNNAGKGPQVTIEEQAVACIANKFEGPFVERGAIEAIVERECVKPVKGLFGSADWDGKVITVGVDEQNGEIGFYAPQAD